MRIMIRRTTFLFLLGFVLVTAGCGSGMVLNTPRAKVSTNLPLMRQSITVFNGVPNSELQVLVGGILRVDSLRTGGSAMIPIRTWGYARIDVSVVGYEVGCDNFIGMAKRTFSFNSNGYGIRTETWQVQQRDLRK